MLILRDFPFNSALFGLVSYNDPCTFCNIPEWRVWWIIRLGLFQLAKGPKKKKKRPSEFLTFEPRLSRGIWIHTNSHNFSIRPYESHVFADHLGIGKSGLAEAQLHEFFVDAVPTSNLNLSAKGIWWYLVKFHRDLRVHHPKGSIWEGKSRLFHRNLGWWNIMNLARW